MQHKVETLPGFQDPLMESVTPAASTSRKQEGLAAIQQYIIICHRH